MVLTVVNIGKTKSAVATGSDPAAAAMVLFTIGIIHVAGAIETCEICGSARNLR